MPFLAFSNYTRLLRIITATGLVISINGYQSRVIDQCYRLPIMERMIDANAYAGDQFVDAFESFNPHIGYSRLLQFGSMLSGLSLWMFILYSLALSICIHAIWEIRKTLFPNLPAWSDWLLVAIFSLCKAGNIGTNHLWEDHLLDRQIAFSLGWVMLATWIKNDSTISSSHNTIASLKISILCGITAVIHPGLGLLYVALWLGVFGLAWLVGNCNSKQFGTTAILLISSMIPWGLIYLPQAAVLKQGVEQELFWSLATELQGPQHMRPIYWRSTQWYAAIALLIAGIAQIALSGNAVRTSPAIKKTAAWIFIITLGLLIAVPGIEIFKSLNITMAQPFRLATIMRGMMLILILPGLVARLQSKQLLQLCHGCALILSLRQDMALTVMIVIELILQFAKMSHRNKTLMTFCYIVMQLSGSYWLLLHDPRKSYYLIIAGDAIGIVLFMIQSDRDQKRNEIIERLIAIPSTHRRQIRIAIYAWLLPILAILFNLTDSLQKTWAAEKLAGKYRVFATPLSDAEKLGVWIDRHMPKDVLVLTPPRDKSLRSWSHRSIVVNVAGSPYQASALKTWAERLQSMSGLSTDIATADRLTEIETADSLDEFCRRWPVERVKFETYYEKASAREILSWADRYHAGLVVAPTWNQPDDRIKNEDFMNRGWRKLHTQGRLTLWGSQNLAVPHQLP